MAVADGHWNPLLPATTGKCRHEWDEHGCCRNCAAIDQTKAHQPPRWLPPAPSPPVTDDA